MACSGNTALELIGRLENSPGGSGVLASADKATSARNPASADAVAMRNDGFDVFIFSAPGVSFPMNFNPKFLQRKAVDVEEILQGHFYDELEKTRENQRFCAIS